VSEHLVKMLLKPEPEQPRYGDLSTIDSDGAELSSVVDLQNGFRRKHRPENITPPQYVRHSRRGGNPERARASVIAGRYGPV
jgi:hypothetical protein